MSETTNIWQEYENGVEFKRKIDYYNTVDENYRYFQGEQWGNTESEGLPTPVFNVIKPVVRYKVSTIMQNDTKIRYMSENSTDLDYPYLNEVTSLLSDYSETLWERLKMDFNNEMLLQEGAITGNGFSYFYLDENTNEINIELVDGTNIYPANPNIPSIEEQRYITIAFRRSCEEVREEAKKAGFKDIELIVPDTETKNLAGKEGKIEIRDSDMCIVLLKMWRDKKTDTIHYAKSTKSCVYIEDEDLKIRRYPIAMMTWENKKNCFFGVSDVTGLIPNQDYINTIAAMIMASTTFTAFPKMVYNEDYVDNPNNSVGVAIGVNGSNMPISDIISYISPQSTSSDVFNMFDRTIDLTKDLMGANDNALGDIDVSTTSGRAILAVLEQTSLPLESIKRRFYNYLEDIALIWAEFWRCGSDKAKAVTVKGENGNDRVYYISSKAFKKLMLNTRIEIGPSTRWSEITLLKTLENLLSGGYISFEWYINLLPENSGIPKMKILELMEKAKREQAESNENNIDVDEIVNEIDADTAKEIVKKPSILENIIQNKIDSQG
ncbi:MAG: hypothetical protein IJQ50_02435 [Clostridia bacterium]|nr:hypothetical protein [Clostridia bacterium]